MAPSSTQAISSTSTNQASYAITSCRPCYLCCLRARYPASVCPCSGPAAWDPVGTSQHGSARPRYPWRTHCSPYTGTCLPGQPGQRSRSAMCLVETKTTTSDHYSMHKWMNGVMKWMVFYATILHLWGYARSATTWANEFVMNHALGAGLIIRPVDQQSTMLPLCYGRPLLYA